MVPTISLATFLFLLTKTFNLLCSVYVLETSDGRLGESSSDDLHVSTSTQTLSSKDRNYT